MGVWSGWQDLWSLMSGVLGVTMVVLARLERAVLSKPVRKLNCGFTLIELMVTVAVFAILVAIAMPDFSSQVQSGRAQMAAQAFARAVANARAVASQTGRRTDLSINTVPSGVTGCTTPAWMLSQGSSVMNCFTKQDFTSRYEGTTFPSQTTTITYLPTGIGTNGVDQTYTFTSGKVTKQVTIHAGGTVDLL